MNVACDTTLILTYDELLFLLEGCGINQLHLPLLATHAINVEDAAKAYVRLTRDGLLPETEDNLQSYSPELRDMLAVMRDCERELVFRTAADWRCHRCLYLTKDQSVAMLLQEDERHAKGISVMIGSATDLCNYLLEELCVADVSPVSIVQPTTWNWSRMRADGLLFSALYYQRGGDCPFARLLAIRTCNGDELFQNEGESVWTNPLGPKSLLLWKENHDFG